MLDHMNIIKDYNNQNLDHLSGNNSSEAILKKSQDQNVKQTSDRLNADESNYESHNESPDEIDAGLPNPGGNTSKPLHERDNNPYTNEQKDDRKSHSDSNPNNIFITERPGEGDYHEDQEDEQHDQHELPEDKKQDEPNPPNELVPYPEEGEEREEEELDIIYSQEEIASFRNIFDMFDKEKVGYINLNDFQSIMDSLNRNMDEVQELLYEFGFGRETGKLSFEEFIVLMQALEKRIIISEQDEQLVPEGEHDDEGQLVGVEDHESPRSATEEERARYGSLLPRTGVHFLPDGKVIDFLKLLDNYRKT
jgi:hypothetical protein